MSDQPIPMDLNGPEPQQDPIFQMHSAAIREMAEPRDGVTPTPVSFLLACFALCAWGGWYIGTYHGDFSVDVFNENSRGGLVAAAPVKQDPVLLGKEVYGTCLQCHQATGKGIPGSYPPLVGSEYVLGDERRLAAILLNGLNGELTVLGQKYNSQMPAWGPTKTDEEIAAVLTHVRSTWGNKAPAVKEELVAAVRKEVTGKGEFNAASLEAFAASKPAAAAPAPAAK
jgi:mono/diheme cytochrome c family protein